jgi:RES domain-containing protein
MLAWNPSPRVFGSEWARAARSLVLAVPSIVIPEEPNYLLNPKHSAFAHIRVTGPQQFQFDPRLLK